MDIFYHLIRQIDLPEVLLVVGAMDMIIPHLGRKENCLLMSKRKEFLGLRIKKNCLWYNSTKG
jgi:hypothetical protein